MQVNLFYSFLLCGGIWNENFWFKVQKFWYPKVTSALYPCATRVFLLENQRQKVQIEAKIRGSPSEHLDEKDISRMILYVCVMQLRTIFASDATLSTSELRQLDHRKMLRLTVVSSASPYTHITLRWILFYVSFETWLQFCFRCKFQLYLPRQ